jgi:hypothetical protein
MPQKTAAAGGLQSALTRFGKIILWLFAALGIFIFVLAMIFLVTGYSSTSTSTTASADKIAKLNEAVDRLSKAQTFLELYNKTTPKTAELRQAYYQQLEDAAARVDTRLRPLVENMTSHMESVMAFITTPPQIATPGASASCEEQLNYTTAIITWLGQSFQGTGMIIQDFSAFDNMFYSALRQDIASTAQAARELNSTK